MVTCRALASVVLGAQCTMYKFSPLIYTHRLASISSTISVWHSSGELVRFAWLSEGLACLGQAFITGKRCVPLCPLWTRTLSRAGVTLGEIPKRVPSVQIDLRFMDHRLLMGFFETAQARVFYARHTSIKKSDFMNQT